MILEEFMKVNKFVEWMEESYCLEWIESVSLSPDNKYIMSGSGDWSVKVFDLDTKKLFRHFENLHKGRFVEWDRKSLII